MGFISHLCELVVTYAVIFGLFYFVGAGLAGLCLSSRLIKYHFLLTPIVGFALTAAVSQFLYFTKAPSGYILGILLLIGSVLNIICYKKKRFFLPERKQIKIFLINMLGLLILSIPLLFYGQQFTSASTDVMVYSTSADYVKEYGLKPVSLDHAFESYGFKPLIEGYKRLGLVYTHSYINIILGTNSSFTFLPFGLALSSMSIMGGYVLLRLFNVREMYTYLFTFFIYLNTLYLSGVFRGFLSQVSVMSLFILCTIIYLDFMERVKEYRYRDLFLFSIAMAGILAVYYSYFTCFVMFALSYNAYLLINKEHPLVKHPKDYFIKTMYFISVTMAMSFKAVESLLKLTGMTYFPASKAIDLNQVNQAGDINYFVPLSEVTGISPHFHEKIGFDLLKGYKYVFIQFLSENTASKLSAFVEWIFFILSALVILSAIKFLFVTRKQKNSLFFISILTSFFVAAGITIVQNYTYGFYKTISTLSIFFVMLFICTLQHFLSHSSNKNSKKKYIFIFVIIIMGLNFCSTLVIMLNTSSTLNKINQKDFKEIAQLTSNLKQDEKLLSIEAIPIYQLMMQFYVRKPILIFEEPFKAIDETKFSLKTNTDYDYVLLPNNQKNSYGIFENEDPYLVGKYYSVYRK